jgi:putative hydrolase of the HAD superfamily
MIEAITFDFWNTLYRPANARPLRMQRLIETLAKNGIAVEADRLEAADQVARTEWNRAWLEDYRTLGAAEWLSVLFGALNAQLPASEFEALAHYFDRGLLDDRARPTLVDGVAAMLDRLSAHYRLGIISDSGLSSGLTLREVLQRDGVVGYFACLTFSDEIGVSKPHARAFTTTLNCLGVDPSHAVHLGDLVRTDIGGAQSIGLRAVRFAAIHDDPDRSAEPDGVVYSFGEFEEWLLEQQ